MMGGPFKPSVDLSGAVPDAPPFSCSCAIAAGARMRTVIKAKAAIRLLGIRLTEHSGAGTVALLCSYFIQPAEPTATDHLSAIAGLLVQRARLSSIRQCALAILIERTEGGATELESSIAGLPEESARLSVVSVLTQAIEIEHSQ